PRSDDGGYAIRAAALAGAAAMAVTAPWAITQARYVADEQVHRAANAGAIDPAAFRSALVAHPGDAYLRLVIATALMRQSDRRALRFVNNAMQVAPYWTEPHALLAEVLDRWGLTSQSLLEMRLAMSLSPTYRTRFASRLVARGAPLAQILAAAPAGASGEEFLEAVGRASVGSPSSPVIDAAILERNPLSTGALLRAAGRAHDAHQNDLRRDLLRRVVAASPADADGHIQLAHALAEAGDAGAAEDTLRAALPRVTDRRSVLFELARLAANRRDAEAMHGRIQEAIEESGADVGERARGLGLLGQLEEGMGHRAAALTAYEQANTLSFPAHPYRVEVIRVADQLGAASRARGACDEVDSIATLPAEIQAICARVRTSRAPDVQPELQ
ncbi:MAG: hypothetical protein WCJ30_28250, partial [Deltaproteobacteria bacterium]